ncbi:AAA family ATPase [Actinoallomurus sp. NPDC052308]|uniref:AAA family ATPase n=1 Tax=Actinoallomurus sp. NPDC052308 TaxID=3155530 RepID=UPI00342AA102
MLHGRERELAVVAETLSRVRDGGGAALAVVGDPGTGRTALLEHVLGRATTSFRTLGTSGFEQETALPYAGLHKLLWPVSDRIGRLPAAQAAALAPVTGEGPAPSAEPFVLGTAVHRLLTDAAADGPVLCWVDDAHLLDRVSLNALAFAARRPGDEPLAILLTAGLETSAATDRLRGVPSLRLGPLGDRAARALLDDLLGAEPGADLAADLIDLAAGNPLALSELAAALTPDQLAGAAPPPAALPVHSRLRALHRRRYRALPSDARRVVLLVACDERLELRTLARAATRAGVDPRALETARRSGLIRVDGETVETPDPLIRSSLYADASLAERLAAHRALAAVLDQDRLRQSRHRAASAGGPDARLCEELVCEAAAARRSGRHADAAPAWRQAAALTADAGGRAVRLLAAATDSWLAGRTRTARSLLRAARPYARSDELRGLSGLLYGQIELRDGAPASAVQILVDAADRLAGSHRTRAVLALMFAAEAGCVAGDHRQYRRIGERAAAIALDGVRTPVAELMLAHLDGMAATFGGRHDEAAGPLRRVLRLAEGLDGCAAKSWASLAAFALGEDRRARDLATMAVTRARLRGTAALLPWALSTLALTQVSLGEFAAATSVSLEGLRAARACGQENCAADHLAMLTLLAAVQGDRDTARARANSVAEAAKKRGLTRPAAFAAWALGCLDLADDRPEEGAARLRSLAGTRPADLFTRVLATPDFIEAAVRCGDREGTETALAAFDRWARSTAGPARTALAERCHALLAEDDAAAEEHFAEALRLHRQGGSAFELARTEFMYGRRLRRSRRPRAARGHLRDARQLFEHCGAALWAERAQAELRAAGEPAEPGTRRRTDDLTPHQREIARLVADGATNREIAARLVLSPRTVDHHLRNIFVRLGVRSRVELVHLFR